MKGTARFLLRSPKMEKSVVMMRIYDKRFRRGRFSYSTGVQIGTSDFIDRDDKVTRDVEANEELARLGGLATAWSKNFPHTANLENEELKRHLNEARGFRSDEESRSIPNMVQFIRQCVSERRPVISSVTGGEVDPKDGVLKNWKSLANNIEWFVRDAGYSCRIERIDKAWWQRFVRWLRQPHSFTTRRNNKVTSVQSSGLADSTIGKYTKDLKKFLNLAEEDGQRIPGDHRGRRGFNIKPRTANSDEVVYLTQEEVELLEKLNLMRKPGLSLARDWLLLACLTGQRYEDWKKLSPENIITDGKYRLFKIVQEKTANEVEIPISPIVQRVMMKHGGRLPDPVSNQKMNKNLKSACRLAGIDLVIRTELDGSKVLKWQRVTTHTGRRSFCTNAYKAGIPILEIMYVSGHKTETEFLKYIRLSKREVTYRIAEHAFFKVG